MTSTTPHHTAEVHTLPYDQAAQRAITALTSGQETFTRTQVAYLMGLALQVGITAGELEQADDPALWHLAYETGYADGISDGEEGALAEVWEGIRFAYSGPRRQPDPRNGIRGNLTAEDAAWWAAHDLKQINTRREADAKAREPRPDDYPGGGLGVDWETGRPVRHLEVAA